MRFRQQQVGGVGHCHVITYISKNALKRRRTPRSLLEKCLNVLKRRRNVRYWYSTCFNVQTN